MTEAILRTCPSSCHHLSLKAANYSRIAKISSDAKPTFMPYLLQSESRQQPDTWVVILSEQYCILIST